MPAVRLCEETTLLLKAARLDLRTREFMLASQDAPGILPLKKDENAGIEPTTIATSISQVLIKRKLSSGRPESDKRLTRR